MKKLLMMVIQFICLGLFSLNAQDLTVLLSQNKDVAKSFKQIGDGTTISAGETYFIVINMGNYYINAKKKDGTVKKLNFEKVGDNRWLKKVTIQGNTEKLEILNDKKPKEIFTLNVKPKIQNSSTNGIDIGTSDSPTAGQTIQVTVTEKGSSNKADLTDGEERILDNSKTYIIKVKPTNLKLGVNGKNDKLIVFDENGEYELSKNTFEDVNIASIELYDEKQIKVFSQNIKYGQAQKSPEVLETCDEPLLELYKEYIDQNYSNESNLSLFKSTNYGLILDKGSKCRYDGPEYVHIFFDQYGNSLLTTPPVGIPNLQYVVHIIYKAKDNNNNFVYLSLRKTKGSYSDNLPWSGTKPTAAPKDESNETQSAQVGNCRIVENTMLLSTSTSTIGFEIYQMEGKKAIKIASHDIKMSRIYQGNIGVSLNYSSLSNVNYELKTSPIDNTKNVVKESGHKGGRALVNIMATFYWSPITSIIYGIQRMRLKNGKTTLSELNNPVARFQTYSKSNLYMRPIYERFYPTIGISMNDQSFQNLVFGVNWEFARGGSFFIGGHFARVNTFESPTIDVDGNTIPNGEFKFGETQVSQQQFDISTDRQFKVGLALGITIDFTVFSTLFSRN